jgi:probable blue pigment (indigoidine) exporter
MSVRVLALTALAPAVWGSTYVVTTELLPPDRPLLASLLRALPAGLALLAIRRALPPRGLRWKSAALGVLNIGIFMPLLFLSAYRLPGGVAATLGAIGPVIVAGLAWALLQERLLPVRVVAGVTGAGGVALLVLGASARLDALGVAAGLLGTASMALGTVLTRRWVRDHHPLDVTAWQLTAGGLALIPVTLVGEGLPATVTVAHVTGWAYLGVVGGALAYALWFRGLSRLPAAAAAFLPLLSPLVAALLGLAVLGQNLALRQWAGFVIALGSMVAGALLTPGTATKGQTDATDLDGDHRQHAAGAGGRPDRPLVGGPRPAVR